MTQLFRRDWFLLLFGFLFGAAGLLLAHDIAAHRRAERHRIEQSRHDAASASPVASASIP